MISEDTNFACLLHDDIFFYVGSEVMHGEYLKANVVEPKFLVVLHVQTMKIHT